MYKESIQLLKEQGIIIEQGMTMEEIKKAEEIYDIQFPRSLRAFLMQALPVSKGFYNWRDVTKKNIDFIKQMILNPVENICELAEEIEWNDDWGNEPESIEIKVETVREKVRTAPKLIPVFSHRYMPMVKAEKPPIISLHGTDIIYYGENLEDYIKIEFGIKQQTEISFLTINSIPFWSEIM